MKSRPAITVGPASLGFACALTGPTLTPSSVTSRAAAIRPLMLVPPAVEALKSPLVKATKFAASPMDAHDFTRALAGARRRGPDPNYAGKHGHHSYGDQRRAAHWPAS